MRKKRNRHLIKLSANILSLRLAVVLFIADILVGTLGYVLIEDFTFEEAVYMSLITISTVGYTEVEPLQGAGRWFTSAYILINILLLAYLLAIFSYYIIQGELFKIMHQRNMQNDIDELHDHVIVCGYGRHGREVVDYFTSLNQTFVLVDKSPEVIEDFNKHLPGHLFVEGDATEDEVLENAGVRRASALIASLPDDAENLFIVLTARQENAGLTIISRANHRLTEKKLKRAGANHVIMPEQIGGFYMATLVSKPGAVGFFSYLTQDHSTDIDLEDIYYNEIPEHLRDKPLSELGLRRDAGVNVISFCDELGKYHINPSPDTVLRPGCSYIVLGDRQQLKALANHFKSDQ